MLRSGPDDTRSSAVASGTRDPHWGPKLCRGHSTLTGHSTVGKTDLVLFSKTPLLPRPSVPASITDTTVQPDMEPLHLDRIPAVLLPCALTPRRWAGPVDPAPKDIPGSFSGPQH